MACLWRSGDFYWIFCFKRVVDDYDYWNTFWQKTVSFGETGSCSFWQASYSCLIFFVVVYFSFTLAMGILVRTWCFAD